MSDALSADRRAAPSLRLSGRGIDDVPRLQTEGAHMLRGAGGEPAPGSSEDQGVLARAIALRFPDLRELSGREKINALLNFITDTAIVRGELEELRLGANLRAFEARTRLARLPTPTLKTRAATDDARRAAAPDIAEQLDGAQWLVDRCAEQINRLGGSDYDAASRAYTLLSG